MRARAVRAGATVCGQFVDTGPNPTGPELCVSAGQGLFFVAGAGFEPATSGSIRATAEDHRSGQNQADSRSTVRMRPALTLTTLTHWYSPELTQSGH
jgi:hypothetical protein